MEHGSITKGIFYVTGMSCSSCVAKIEREISKRPGKTFSYSQNCILACLRVLQEGMILEIYQYMLMQVFDFNIMGPFSSVIIMQISFFILFDPTCSRCCLSHAFSSYHSHAPNIPPSSLTKMMQVFRMFSHLFHCRKNLGGNSFRGIPISLQQHL